MHDALFEGRAKFNNYIKKDVQEARSAGIRGTPAFVIGKTTEDIVSGTLIAGTHALASFKQEIDKLLH
jgi:protein-disulfide isomerase